MGQLTATLATCAHLSPDNQARLHSAISARFPLCLVRRALAPLTPKPLKMSAYGTAAPLLRDPQGSCQHRGRCPPAFATWQGAGENLLHPYPETLGRLQPVKAKPQAVASQALTGFQLRPLRLVLLPPRRWRGVKGDEVVHFTLDALESTQHSP